MQSYGLGAYNDKSLAFLQMHIGSAGTSPSQLLKDGVLTGDEYQQLKTAFVQEGLASANDPELDQTLNHFLADALDGRLDKQSLPGMCEALEKLAAHDAEANAFQFAEPGSFAKAGEVLKVGNLITKTPTGRNTFEFRTIIEFGASGFEARLQDAAQSLGPKAAEVLVPYRAQLEAAGFTTRRSRENIDVLAVFEKLSPADQKLFLSCLDQGNYLQAKSILAVNQVLQSSQGQPLSPGENDVMNALPNLEYAGPITIEANNPEQVKKEGKIFSSSELEPPVEFGTGENQSFNYYTYSDDRAMNSEDVYQAVVIRNPGPESVTLRVQGSGHTNNPDALRARCKQIQAIIDKLEKTGNVPDDLNEILPNIKKNGELEFTRIADYLLTLEQIVGQQQIPAPGEQLDRVIPAGGAIVVYTKIPKGSNTLRAAYQFQVMEPSQGQKLDVDVLTTRNKLDGKPVFEVEKNQSQCGVSTLTREMYEAYVDKQKMIDPGHELMQGTDFDGALANPDLKLQDWDKDGSIGPGDFKFHNEQVKKRLLPLQQAFEKLNDKNDPSGQQRQKLKAQIDEVSKELLKLGRINGVKAFSEVHATIPPIDAAKGPYNLNYAVNTKVMDRGGTRQDQSVPMTGISQFPGGPANKDDIAHGNYNAEYIVNTVLTNSEDPTREFEFAFGSPDASMLDNGSPQPPSYDGNKIDLKPDQTRFTGVVEIQIAGQTEPIRAKMVHGRVQLPEGMPPISVKKGEAKYITFRFIVPTNSVSPQVLNITSQ